MAEQLQHQLQADDQENTTKEHYREPVPGRSIFRRFHSLLGKRKSEEDEPEPSADASNDGNPTLSIDPGRIQVVDRTLRVDIPQNSHDGRDPISVDGTADKPSKRWKGGPVAAIFIHAGAGYHSTANERIHLEACSE